MNRGGVYRSSLVQQMIEGNPNLWSMNSQEIPSLLSSPSASSSSSFSSAASAVFPKYSKFASFNPMLIPCHENQEQLPVVSWSQLLLGEFGEEEDGCRNVANYPKRMENNWKDQIMCSSANTQVLDVKKEDAETGHGYYSGKDKEGSSWSQQLAVAASSPRSCVTSSNILDFSNCKTQRKHHQLDNSNSECNSNGGAALKKARIQSSSVQSTLKVRKEKLGDRIAALHQLVSPFGKTDTASVLSEAIGYIRFLQTQIQALSSPYLRNGSRNSRNSVSINSNIIYLTMYSCPHQSYDHRVDLDQINLFWSSKCIYTGSRFPKFSLLFPSYYMKPYISRSF
ncbi:transcription factor bHLH133 [Canna indica]|uniref:Transcription factor bHLH133 n=1 Tax=Canna indica TaxID=4628 RepID=A0AAQ3JXC5_9LILI|nr:transcription factor bHLH133 [Canna indica]